jgi:L-seryl-tRNA(Ser) seleniumtransferase
MDARRALPSVDGLLRHPALRPLLDCYARPAVTGLVRQAVDAARREAVEDAPSVDALAERIVQDARRRWRSGPQPVINATGVVLHTNLGRAPLSRAAAAAATAVATGYSALEFDLARGTRGARYEHLSFLLRDVTGAEDGIAVNNNAAGLVLALAALCRRREVIVSRGQAVEIGGGFRIPAIMRESGAKLIEVGTTNRTRPSDYAAALSARTAAILRVHASNFRIVGFTETVDVASLAALAQDHGVPLIDDVGSGSLLDVRPYGLAPEPLVQESVAAGADLVLFSGDKLLGGPQAGLIVGRAELIARLRQHPLMRALRPDKITIAALGATLLHYVRGEADREIPVWRMIGAQAPEIEARARAWCAQLPAVEGVLAGVEPGASTIGGGSLPGETLPTHVLALHSTRRAASWASATAAALRAGTPPVVARIEDNRVVLDPRTVLSEQDAPLVAALGRVISSHQ